MAALKIFLERERKRDREEMLDVFYAQSDHLLVPEEEKYPTDELLSELKTASGPMQWILEIPEDRIVGKIGIGPGDLRTLVDLSHWLLYSASEIAKLVNLKKTVQGRGQRVMGK